MMSLDPRTHFAASLLGGLLSQVPDPKGEGVEAADIEQVEGGAAATILTPWGDSYRVSITYVEPGAET